MTEVAPEPNLGAILRRTRVIVGRYGSVEELARAARVPVESVLLLENNKVCKALENDLKIVVNHLKLNMSSVAYVERRFRELCSQLQVSATNN